jgi:heterotetrameric sarcosine oxidase gamma subunit
VAELSLTDLSSTPKWRVFAGHEEVRPGTSKGSGDHLVWSVSPGEWTVLGDQPDEAVDLTHVRSMFRLTGAEAPDLIGRVCALDLSADMFPNGAAARSLVAGAATEIVRDDLDGLPSYLLLPSSSFKTYMLEVVRDAGAEFGMV